ncbi:MAG: VOC family protein [Anaerotignaceae bacterium]
MIKKIDHIVITTNQPQKCIDFYKKLGFEAKDGYGRYELFAGDFKINVHFLGKELNPHAQNVQCGSMDVCLEITDNIADVKNALENLGLQIEGKIVQRNGVNGSMKSIYLRDPDGNLVELSSYA